MAKRINQCDVFVLLWGLYYLQDTLYPSGIINQLIQLILILMGLISVGFYILQGNRTVSFINASLLLIGMYFIYGMQIILFGDGIEWTTDSTYLKDSLNSLLPIVFFFMQTRQGLLTQQRIRIYTIYILVVIIARFNSFGEHLSETLDVDFATNNLGYMFVSAIPLIYFFYKRNFLQYFFLAVILFFTLSGMKRGAIVIGAICLMIFIYYGIKNKNNRKNFYTYLLLGLTLLGTIYYVRSLLETNEYFISRVQRTLDGDTSNRDIIYSGIWNTIISEQNLFNILLGHGANSTVRYSGTFAHQDWLETACNNGLVGTIFLSTFFIIMGFEVWKSRKYFPSYLYYCFLTLFFTSLSKTMFSMSIQNLDMYQSMLLGYFAYYVSKFDKVSFYRKNL